MLTKRKQRKRPAKMTIIIIPERLAKPISLGLARNKIYLGLTIIGLFVIGFLAITYGYHYNRAEIAKVKAYKKEIVQQKETIDKLTTELQAIEKKQEYVAAKQAEIKKLIGVDSDIDGELLPTRSATAVAGNITKKTEKEAKKVTRIIRGELGRLENEINGLRPQVIRNLSYYRALPNQWPVRGEITSAFGWRRSPFGGRKQTFHDGIDIANNAGEKITSAGDGIVVFAGWQGAYGNTVIIDHGYGLKTKYGHNSRLLVKVGDEVKKGEEIALLGNSGLSTGPHLHFTVFKDDQPLDPLIYLDYEDKK